MESSECKQRTKGNLRSQVRHGGHSHSTVCRPIRTAQMYFTASTVATVSPQEACETEKEGRGMGSIRSGIQGNLEKNLRIVGHREEPA